MIATWTDQFYQNYSVLKNLAGRVPANLQPLYASLMKQAQTIDYNIQHGMWQFGSTRDAVTNFFDLAQKFAARLGPVSHDPMPAWDMGRTSVDDVGDDTTSAVSNAADMFVNFEQDMEQLAIFVAIGLGALFLGPPLLRLVTGGRLGRA